ncbi:hypothetical protein Pcinc_001986 [Petrolisthes cinctipes]|uniref:m7GpppN-mRNA hydrolase NUDT17 n=1 Tax=Petrolisthes cinctipes TaxID=88211 RepID=A0AAE1GJL7_PETCI|nr:hypothetical protein Pcinc_001986 [Petrolisthes cinctipes]
MAGTGYRQVLVQLRRPGSKSYQRAVFGECVLGALGVTGGEGRVQCHQQDNSLWLQCPDQSSTTTTTTTTTTKLMHPPFCPCYHLADTGRGVQDELKGRGVAVGVAVLLEAADGLLLLTRRASHMRTFPNTWVPPGGHIEEGESLETAVLRELEEETGLSVTEDERRTCHILGLWESVFPPILSLGDPRRQHVVVYLHITLTRSSTQLQQLFKLCPDEVDAAVWLTPDLIRMSVWSEEKAGMDKETLIPVTLVNKHGDQASGTIEASFLLSNKNPDTINMERVSTGSRFALSLWLEQHQKSEKQQRSSQKDLYELPDHTVGHNALSWTP